MNHRFPFRAIHKVERGRDAQGRTVFRFDINRWHPAFLLWYWRALAGIERQRGLSPWSPGRVVVKLVTLVSRGR